LVGKRKGRDDRIREGLRGFLYGGKKEKKERGAAMMG